MANKVKFGLRNVWVAQITSISGSTYTYSTPFSIPGAVNLTATAEGDSDPFYADDVQYFVNYANNGYTGELEVALLPDAFKTAILGELTDNNDALIETASATTQAFALGFEVQGDDKPRRTWFYNVTCARPNTTAGTKEANITPQTDTLNITISPRVTDQFVKAVMTLTSSNSAAFSSFFSSVYERVVTP